MHIRPMPAWAGGRRPLRRYPGVFRRWMLPALALAAALFTTWLVSPDDPSLPSSPLVGRAQIVDGDTLRLAGHRIRLKGIDAPELAQTCKAGDGELWACGETSRRRLAGLAHGELSCAPRGLDRYQRVLATCHAGEADVGAAMVKAGLALADGGYDDEETYARTASLGLWAGRFERPADWRRAHPDGDGNAARPSRVSSFIEWVRTVFLR